MDGKEHTNLTTGTRYKVRLHDCCIDGEFEAVFLKWIPSADGSVEKDYAVFDNGVKIGPEWSSQWEEEEVVR